MSGPSVSPTCYAPTPTFYPTPHGDYCPSAVIKPGYDCGVCGEAPWCGFDGCRNGCGLRLTAEALFLTLAPENKRSLILDNTPVTIRDTDDLAYGASGTIRLGVEWEFVPDRWMQFVWYGARWDESTGAAGVVGVPGDPAGTGGFNGLQSVDVASWSSFDNAEINFLHDYAHGSFQLIWGFRHISLDERVRITGVPSPPAAAAQNPSFYNVSTNNDLYGMQLGGRSGFDFAWFQIEATGKIGLYRNNSLQTTFLSDGIATFLGGGPTRDSTTAGRNTAIVGELGFNAIWPITPSIRVTGGYNLLWLGGVARSLEQLDFNDTTVDPNAGRRLRDDGDAFLHGAHIGLDLAWGGPRRVR